MKKIIKHKLLTLICMLATTSLVTMSTPIVNVYAAASPAFSTGPPVTTSYQCGSGSDAVKTSIDIGCEKKGNPIMDLTFAIIKLLSDGVGLVIVASLIWASIQYIGSRGDPNSTAMAIKRIRSNVTALVLFIFAYALLNYVVPGQVLQ